jgi:hypothetical protein
MIYRFQLSAYLPNKDLIILGSYITIDRLVYSAIMNKLSNNLPISFSKINTGYKNQFVNIIENSNYMFCEMDRNFLLILLL